MWSRHVQFANVEQRRMPAIRARVATRIANGPFRQKVLSYSSFSPIQMGPAPQSKLDDAGSIGSRARQSKSTLGLCRPSNITSIHVAGRTLLRREKIRPCELVGLLCCIFKHLHSVEKTR